MENKRGGRQRKKYSLGGQESKRDLNDIIARGELCLMIGDLNKSVGSDELGVAGNNSHVSFGSQLIKELVATEEWVLVNNTEMTEGGPWTREDPSDHTIKSCLDLVLCSSKNNGASWLHNLFILYQEQLHISQSVYVDVLPEIQT